MTGFDIIEILSDPGSPERANEDITGFNASCALVLDGATGLSPDRVMTGEASDAGWLVTRARELIIRDLAGDAPPSAVLKKTVETLAAEFSHAADGRAVPRYALPSASIVLAHLYQGRLTLYGLGDCVAFVRDGSGAIRSFSALRGFFASESQSARAHIRRTGGLKASGSLLADWPTMSHLRKERSLQNTQESGVWTLGLEPEAMRHLTVQSLVVSGGCEILLCSDGFSALTDAYGALTPKQLMDAARSDGLAGLLSALRHIERVEDPDGLRFPRFKRSDDATAMLLRAGGD